jgi:hypothetical protein
LSAPECFWLPASCGVNLLPRRLCLIAGAYILALIGGLPPLVHLRRRARSGDAKRRVDLKAWFVGGAIG